jgi:hypothetical protein
MSIRDNTIHYIQPYSCPICIQNITPGLVELSYEQQRKMFCYRHVRDSIICKKCSVCSVLFARKKPEIDSNNINSFSASNIEMDGTIFSDMSILESTNIVDYVCIVQNWGLCDNCIEARREIKNKIYGGRFTYGSDNTISVRYNVSLIQNESCVSSQEVHMTAPRINISKLYGFRELTCDEIEYIEHDEYVMSRIIPELYSYYIIPKSIRNNERQYGGGITYVTGMNSDFYIHFSPTHILHSDTGLYIQLNRDYSENTETTGEIIDDPDNELDNVPH